MMRSVENFPLRGDQLAESAVTTIDIVNACVGGAALLISLTLALAQLWRFRHPVRISCATDWRRANADGTRREFDAWRVRLLSVRQRPVPIDEIWFLARDGTTIGMPTENDVSFPLLLTDHVPQDVWYDLDRFSEPGRPRQLRCAVAVENGGRSHVGWVNPKPRLWRLRRPPRRRGRLEVASFRAPGDDDGQ